MNKEIELLNTIAYHLEELDAYLANEPSAFDEIAGVEYPFDMSICDMAAEWRHLAERLTIAQEQREQHLSLSRLVNSYRSTGEKLDFLEGYIKALADVGQKDHHLCEFANVLHDELLGKER